MPLVMNILATLAVALTLFAKAAALPLYAFGLACVPAAAFFSASVSYGCVRCELRRDLAAALNGACMLTMSGVTLMCLNGVVCTGALFPLFAAAAALAAWNLVCLTEPEQATVPPVPVPVPVPPMPTFEGVAYSRECAETHPSEGDGVRGHSSGRSCLPSGRAFSRDRHRIGRKTLEL